MVSVSRHFSVLNDITELYNIAPEEEVAAFCCLSLV
jgi:hypothetical protein